MEVLGREAGMHFDVTAIHSHTHQSNRIFFLAPSRSIPPLPCAARMSCPLPACVPVGTMRRCIPCVFLFLDVFLTSFFFFLIRAEQRCQRPRTIVGMVRAFAGANVNKKELIIVEGQLQRIMDDLQIPMLTDIRRLVKQIHDREKGGVVDENALQEAVQKAIGIELDARSARGRGSVREIIEAKVSGRDAAAPPSGWGLAGQVMARLGRVRFEMLEEGEDVLGEGTFGTVRAGEYMGKEVAIKKARGIVGDEAVRSEFRWVIFNGSNILGAFALNSEELL